MSKIEDTYKNIALEYIKTKDIVKSYYKYHSESKVTDSAPYRLLGDVRFNEIKEQLVREIEPDLEKNIQACLNVLLTLSQTSEKKNDRIIAATNYLKFTIGEVNKVKDITKENPEYNNLRRDIFLSIGNKEDTII